MEKKYGPGILKYVDGSKYEGEWVNGVKHLSGTFTDKDGKTENQAWYQGKRQEEKIEFLKEFAIL